MKIDTKKTDVLKALQSFGFVIIREKEHITLRNLEGKVLSVPNHKRVKGSTLQKELTRVGIDKKKFWEMV
jgi:predicted RNA binding protein YcfA (HicA-like mRNA interferase family)